MGYIAETLEISMVGDMTEKQKAIALTHKLLRNKLRQGMTWKDGKHYNVTERKQAHLQAQLLIGSGLERKGVNPEEIKLRWNESGRAKTDWTYFDLWELAGDIHAYVEPKVVLQQETEEKIELIKDDDAKLNTIANAIDNSPKV
jgi:hypothetical protein